MWVLDFYAVEPTGNEEVARLAWEEQLGRRIAPLSRRSHRCRVQELDMATDIDVASKHPIITELEWKSMDICQPIVA